MLLGLWFSDSFGGRFSRGRRLQFFGRLFDLFAGFGLPVGSSGSVLMNLAK